MLPMFLLSCNNSETDREGADTTTSTNVSYAYPVQYSSDFKMGDPKYSQMVVDLWKDYDDNQLDRSKSMFADTITMLTPGSAMTGPVDSIMNFTKMYRNSFSTVKSDVDAVMAVKANNTGEDWVLIWGTEHHTSNNKEDSIHLQETWRINKDGKIDMMMQYGRQPAPAQQ